MTRPLFRDDAYATEAPARVVSINDRGGVVLEAALFYPTGGGQPGDSGWLRWEGGEMAVATSVKGEGDEIVLVPAEGAVLPPVGAEGTQAIDWARRYRLMRMHTALHLLSVVLPFPVTGGAVGEVKSRLDFAMEHPIEDKPAVEAALNALVAQDLPVTSEWISDAELEANPGLVKTMSVQPPKGAGRVRLVRIGGEAPVDLQPCGGTHVARTGEIGALRIGKVEKKGRLNRRVHLHLVE